jgi:hypothetical protein
MNMTSNGRAADFILNMKDVNTKEEIEQSKIMTH